MNAQELGQNTVSLSLFACNQKHTFAIGSISSFDSANSILIPILLPSNGLVARCNLFADSLSVSSCAYGQKSQEDGTSFWNNIVCLHDAFGSLQADSCMVIERGK